jgi:hypothetical protein
VKVSPPGFELCGKKRSKLLPDIRLPSSHVQDGFNNGDSAGHQILVRNVEGLSSADLQASSTPNDPKANATAQNDENAGKKSVLQQGQNKPPNSIRTTTTPPKSSEMPRQEPKTGRSPNECPLVFGFGHQKSGTTTIVKALGSISNVTARNDIWPFWARKTNE